MLYLLNSYVMEKLLSETDEKFEQFMLKTERKLKHQLYVMLFCSVVCLLCLWYVMATDETLSKNTLFFCRILSIVVILCDFGEAFCYYSVKKNRRHYEKFKKKMKEQREALRQIIFKKSNAK